jgi:FlaA1/EpsC-like NDP-sugar epimerase
VLRQQSRLLIFNTVVIDVLAVSAAFLSGYLIRDYLFPIVFPQQFPEPLFELSAYLWLYFLTMPLCVASLAFSRLYQPARFASFRRTPIDIAKAIMLAFAILMGLTYILKAQDISRSFMVTFAGVAFVFVSMGRLIVRGSLRRQKGQRDYTVSNVLVVGTDEKAQAFADLIQGNRKWGVNLVGILAENRYGRYTQCAGQHRVIGNLDDLERICQRHVVDDVIFVVSGKILSDMEDLFLLCEELGVNARIAVGIFPHLIARATLEDFSNIPLLTFSTKPTNWAALVIKRIVDLSIAWSALIFAMPLWVLTAIIIKFDSKGPVVFCQER